MKYSTSTPPRKPFSRSFLPTMLALIFAFSLLAPPLAHAASPSYAIPSDLLNAVSEQTGVPADYNSLITAGYLTAAEQRHLEKYNAFSYAVAWHVLLPAFGVYPYPAEFYPEISPHPSWPNGTVYADARAAALLCGLISADDEPNYPITTKDFNSLLSALKTNSYQLPAPETTCPYIIVHESAAVKTGEVPWNIHTYLGRNSLLSAYDLIPAGWLATFETEGYEIRYELPPNHDDPAIPGHVVGGVTDYANKFIAIAHSDPRVTLHEFTHFAAKYAEIYVDNMEYCFYHEAPSVTNIIGVYSRFNASEYLAEFVSYWLLHPDEQAKLRELAPATADLADYVIGALDSTLKPAEPSELPKPLEPNESINPAA